MSATAVEPSPGRRSTAHAVTAARAPSPTPRYVAARQTRTSPAPTVRADRAPTVGANDEHVGADGDVAEAEHARRGAAHPERLEARRPLDARRLEIHEQVGDHDVGRWLRFDFARSSSTTRALTSAYRRAGNHVVNVFSPVTR